VTMPAPVMTMRGAVAGVGLGGNNMNWCGII
jgi:hypothetical protein